MERIKKSGIPIPKSNRTNMKKNLSKSTDLLFLGSERSGYNTPRRGSCSTPSIGINPLTFLEEKLALQQIQNNSLYLSFVYLRNHCFLFYGLHVGVPGVFDLFNITVGP